MELALFDVAMFEGMCPRYDSDLPKGLLAAGVVSFGGASPFHCRRKSIYIIQFDIFSKKWKGFSEKIQNSGIFCVPLCCAHKDTRISSTFYSKEEVSFVEYNV
jgi:hypothetical protein